MDRSDMQARPSYPTFNAATAIEMKKAEEALQKVKQKITCNPGFARYALRKFDKRSPEENEYSAWTTADIQTEVQKLGAEFVKPLLTPEHPMSVAEYELKIENEITKELKKRVISHHTNEERAEKLYLSVKNAHKAKQQHAKGERKGRKEKKIAAEKFWQEAHRADPTEQEQVIGVLGEGAYGKAESVVFGEAGPIVVKKTALPDAQQELQQEAENLQALNHPNIIRMLPTKSTGKQESNFLMQSGGQPLTLLIDGKDDNKIKLQGVQGTDNSLTPEEKTAVDINLGLIKWMIKRVNAGEKRDDLCARVEQMYKETLFSKRDYDNLLYVINDSLKTATDPQQIKLLKKLKALSEAWKLKVPSQRDSGGPLPMKNIQDITRQILSGLSHMHKNGMVHLDMKPDNVLIQPDGTVKLIDFGLARESNDHRNFPELRGSPIFTAPELINTAFHWQGYSEECSEASDIYSAGCLLCQLATGQYYNYAEADKGVMVAMEQFMIHAVNETDQLQEKMFDSIDKRYPHAHEQQQATQLKALLSHMLEPYPEDRPSAAELLGHPFFQQGGQTVGG